MAAYSRPRRSPDGDQKILGNNRDLIKDKELKKIEAEEDTVHGANQHQVEREKILHSPFDIPGKKYAGDRRNPGQQNQDQADAIGRQVIFNAQAVVSTAFSRW